MSAQKGQMSREELHEYVDVEMDELVKSLSSIAPGAVLMQELQRNMLHKFIDAEFPDGIELLPCGECPKCVSERKKDTSVTQRMN